MRDKLGDFSGDISLSGSQTATVANLGSMPATAQSEALIALQSLGFKPQEVNMLIKNVAKDGMSAEEIIRLAYNIKERANGRQIDFRSKRKRSGKSD